jgi:hypothetical protein
MANDPRAKVCSCKRTPCDHSRLQEMHARFSRSTTMSRAGYSSLSKIGGSRRGSSVKLGSPQSNPQPQGAMGRYSSSSKLTI